jgi:hypothetical protein
LREKVVRVVEVVVEDERKSWLRGVEGGKKMREKSL